MFYGKYSSPLGDMIITSDGEAICGVYYCGQKYFPKMDDLVKNDNLAVFDDVKQWFDNYFSGKNPEINFKLNLQGSEFRLKVWRILSEISYGETMTYGEIASRISPTMSAQAVGGAVGHNPIAIIIPCHRVLGVNGKLTGYAGGLDKKIKLLKLENII